MSRKELYDKIKEYNLCESIQKKYGDNFTRVRSNILLLEIQKYENNKKETTEVVKDIVKKSEKPKSVEEKLENLVKFLTLKHLILKSEAESILN